MTHPIKRRSFLGGLLGASGLLGAIRAIKLPDARSKVFTGRPFETGYDYTTSVFTGRPFEPGYDYTTSANTLFQDQAAAKMRIGLRIYRKEAGRLLYCTSCPDEKLSETMLRVVDEYGSGTYVVVSPDGRIHSETVYRPQFANGKVAG